MLNNCSCERVPRLILLPHYGHYSRFLSTNLNNNHILKLISTPTLPSNQTQGKKKPVATANSLTTSHTQAFSTPPPTTFSIRSKNSQPFPTDRQKTGCKENLRALLSFNLFPRHHWLKTELTDMDTFQQIRVRQPHPCRLHGPNPAQPFQLIKVFGNISEMEVSRIREARNFSEIFQTASGALEVCVWCCWER